MRRRPSHSPCCTRRRDVSTSSLSKVFVDSYAGKGTHSLLPSLSAQPHPRFLDRLTNYLGTPSGKIYFRD